MVGTAPLTATRRASSERTNETRATTQTVDPSEPASRGARGDDGRTREGGGERRDCGNDDVVPTYVNDVNRPVNATNVGDALGARGVKKGLAQKYLDALAEREDRV